jgi:bacteriocin-like protein
MKKLEKKELKQIKGGENPFCRRFCRNARIRCIAAGTVIQKCDVLFEECLNNCDPNPL